MNAFLVYIIPSLSITILGAVLFLSSALRERVIPATVLARVYPLIALGFVYGRQLVYALAIGWAYILYYQVTFSLPTASFALSSLMRYYGLTALFLLYVVLTPGILLTFFPRMPFNGLFVHLRRAVGVSVFFFALLHGTIGFFNNLSGNLASVFFLAPRHQFALVASSTAFIIYALMALTSFDIMMEKLGKRWKQLHRFVYLAAILSIFHAFLIGSHFTTPTAIIPVIANFLSLTFVLLEVAATIHRTIRSQVISRTPRSLLRYGMFACIVVLAFYMSNAGVTQKYDPHARHRKGYSKDYVLTTKTSPEKITTNTPITITFSITDKRTNRVVKKFQMSQTKLMHVIVLSHDLRFYNHIHPEYNNDGLFTVATQLPTEGTYNLYVDYSPPDFYENLSIATIKTAGAPEKQPANLTVGAFTKTFEDRYKVTLTPTGPFKVGETVDFTYTLEDTQTGQPVTDLEVYLAAFGHMAAVSEDLSTFTHVHPLNPPLSDNAKGGPTVRFSTFFLKAGRYKFFTQFKHQNKVFVTDFVVEVK